MKCLSLFLCCLVAVTLACVSPAWVNPSPENTPTDTRLTPTATNQVAAVTALEALHVRSEPMGIRIGYLRHDDPVTLTGNCQTGWAQIVWNGGRAWVNASYLSENKCSEEE